MSDNLREALEELATEFSQETTDLQFAAPRIRAILAAHPDETTTGRPWTSRQHVDSKETGEAIATSGTRPDDWTNPRVVSRQVTPWKAAS